MLMFRDYTPDQDRSRIQIVEKSVSPIPCPANSEGVGDSTLDPILAYKEVILVVA